ncbi:MAG: shikimate kinase [Clostridia bacterium]|nr:shikimate kinase [Clostridia bacterium]
MVSNIVLIGMPAAGKSTVGVLLAKSLLMDFVDTDLIIQKKYRMSLCDIITERGSDAFIQLEKDVIKAEDFTNSVIATGGSAVYGEEAMKKLRENAKTVFLTLPIEEIKRRINDIHTRGVVIKNGATLDDLYTERLPLYEKYADITIDCSNLTAEECVDRIIESINN